jgi:hypothetical protein
MPKYVIERDLAGAGQMSAADLEGISKTSVGVLNEMAPRAQWLHSYVTDDKIFCVYIAEDRNAVKEHAEKGGFPCTQINEVQNVIDPTTAGV